MTIRRLFPLIPHGTIPWDLIAPHDAQARANHGQSLDRLAVTGGLPAPAVLAIMEDRAFRPMDDTDARKALLLLTLTETERKRFEQGGPIGKPTDIIDVITD